MDIPDDSMAKFELDDSSKNELSGWQPSFTTVDPEVGGGVSVSASVGPRISLELSITLLGINIGGAGLSLGAPQLQIDAVASADSVGGVCDSPDAHSGVSIDVSLSAELDAFGGRGNPADLPNRFALLSTSTPLFSTCKTYGASSPTNIPSRDDPDGSEGLPTSIKNPESSSNASPNSGAGAADTAKVTERPVATGVPQSPIEHCSAGCSSSGGSNATTPVEYDASSASSLRGVSFWLAGVCGLVAVALG